jgi:hypothetical protein
VAEAICSAIAMTDPASLRAGWCPIRCAGR